MTFEWDQLKNEMNYKKHGVQFETAVLVFEDPDVLMTQDRETDGEERWQSIGMAGGRLLLLVAHTIADEKGDGLRVRIISARAVTRRERRHYEESR